MTQNNAIQGDARLSGANVLAVQGLRAWIGTQQILHDVSLEVPASGVTALLGRNGVGKTTTVRAVLGLVRREGSVLLDGEPIEAEPTYRVVQRGVGYVPENREVFSRLTVLENLQLAARGKHLDLSGVHELFPELEKRAGQAAGTLSGGQQQMVALARALVNDNRLLLVDEPTKGLAPRVVDEVADALERAARHTPMLLVEQDLAVVSRLASRVVVMAEGHVVHSGPAQQFLDDASLVERHLGVARNSERKA